MAAKKQKSQGSNAPRSAKRDPPAKSESPKKPARAKPNGPDKPQPVIIGIGASAGGLESF